MRCSGLQLSPRPEQRALTKPSSVLPRCATVTIGAAYCPAYAGGIAATIAIVLLQ